MITKIQKPYYSPHILTMAIEYKFLNSNQGNGGSFPSLRLVVAEAWKPETFLTSVIIMLKSCCFAWTPKLSKLLASCAFLMDFGPPFYVVRRTPATMDWFAGDLALGQENRSCLHLASCTCADAGFQHSAAKYSLRLLPSLRINRTIKSGRYIFEPQYGVYGSFPKSGPQI